MYVGTGTCCSSPLEYACSEANMKYGPIKNFEVVSDQAKLFPVIKKMLLVVSFMVNKSVLHCGIA
jgi:hypothetical protein